MSLLSDAMERQPKRWMVIGNVDPADWFKGRNKKAKFRRRKNKEPCPVCGETVLVYRWLVPVFRDVIDTRWFCFCGRTEVDDE